MYLRNKRYSFHEALSKLMKYCSYQERSVLEVKKKAYLLGCSQSEIEKIIKYLEEERFLDEDRFISAYVQGKLRVKRWGKYKIREGLKAKGIEEALIQRHLNSITDNIYAENIRYLIKKRNLTGKLSSEKLAKEFRYFLSKGYTYEQLKIVFEEAGLIG